MIEIFDNTGKTLFQVEPLASSNLLHGVNSDEVLSVDFRSVLYKSVPIGSYCFFENRKYMLWQEGGLKIYHSEDYEYNLRLEPENAMLKYLKFENPSDGTKIFDLTTTPKEIVSILVLSLNKRDPSKGWKVGNILEHKELNLSFENTYYIDAIKNICSECECDYLIDGKTIHIGKIKKNDADPVRLGYGKGNGLKGNINLSNVNDKGDAIKVLYVKGGSQNIDPQKYKSHHLLMPKNEVMNFDGEKFEGEEGYQKAHAVGYISSKDGTAISTSEFNTLKYPYIEASKNFEDIKPQRVGSVSEVKTISEKNNIFAIVDKSIPESLNFKECILPGEKMTIIFQSGMLIGREFDVAYTHKERTFEIQPVKGENDKMYPSKEFLPKVGDKYAVFHIELPQSYICDYVKKVGASFELMREAVKHLHAHNFTSYQIKSELDNIAINERGISDKLNAGYMVLLTGAGFDKERKVRIERKKTYLSGEIEVELSNTYDYNRLASTMKQKYHYANAIKDDNWWKFVELSRIKEGAISFTDSKVKEITPSIIDGFWTIGEKPTYVKARADVLTYSVETISGSPIMRNAKGAVTVKAHIYYNLKDITAEAMKNGIKIQWLIVNESGQSRKGVKDEEWKQKHSAEQSNTDTMTFTSDDFEENCNTKIGFEITNEEELKTLINKIA